MKRNNGNFVRQSPSRSRSASRSASTSGSYYSYTTATDTSAPSLRADKSNRSEVSNAVLQEKLHGMLRDVDLGPANVLKPETHVEFPPLVLRADREKASGAASERQSSDNDELVKNDQSVDACGAVKENVAAEESVPFYMHPYVLAAAAVLFLLVLGFFVMNWTILTELGFSYALANTPGLFAVGCLVGGIDARRMQAELKAFKAGRHPVQISQNEEDSVENQPSDAREVHIEQAATRKRADTEAKRLQRIEQLVDQLMANKRDEDTINAPEKQPEKVEMESDSETGESAKSETEKSENEKSGSENEASANADEDEMSIEAMLASVRSAREASSQLVENKSTSNESIVDK